MEALVNPVTSLLKPGSIAIIGASDRSNWFRSLYRNIHQFNAPNVYLVNPKGEPVSGVATYRSLDEIDDLVKLACILVRADVVNSVLTEVAEHGVQNVLVIASGFQEAGAAGRERAKELAAIATEHKLNLLGPNTSGFVNVRAGYAPFGSGIQAPLITGGVGVVSQSGALAGQIMRLAQRRGVGLSAVIGTGNEATLTASDGIEHFVHDDQTSVIATFLEDIKDIPKFRAAAQEAQRRGKPVVALKVGRTPAGQRAALSHTGALVGDDKVIDAAFWRYGVIRVNSLDELVAVAGLTAHHRSIPGRRIAVVAPSGGFCDIVADAASDVGLELPELSTATVEALTTELPVFATAKNPLDLTGGIVADRSIGLKTVRLLAEDDQMDAVVYTNSVPYSSTSADVRPILASLADLTSKTATPIVLQEGLSVDLAAERQALLGEHGLYVSAGLELTLTALSKAAWWTERRRATLSNPPLPEDRGLGNQGAGAARPMSEVEARQLLESAGIPVPPGGVAADPDEAVRIAEKLGYPVVVKGVSAALLHKTDVGAVKLNLDSPSEVVSATEEVLAIRGPGGHIEQVLVCAMRDPGTELLVSVTNDREWGDLLTVGLGGIWVEVLGDTVSRLLPVSEEEIVRMLQELRGSALLRATRRDGAGVDMAVVAQIIGRIARMGLALNLDLDTAEINPLWVRGTQVEALDALIVLREHESRLPA
jgi:acyl-CoA synthetase (NDP forming)